MNREEVKMKLEEIVELVSTHLGCTDQEWDITERIYYNKKNKWVLSFEVEYED